MNARTLTVFRLYQLFNGIIFTGPIWAVFLLSRGLSLTQFGLVEACLHVGMLIAQVPTGALADALGRRRLLVAAGFFTAVAELGYVYAPGFGLICLAGAVHGVAFALRTGADEAYLFDSLAHDDAQAQFPRMLGGLWAVFQFAGAISFMAGGLIATYLAAARVLADGRLRAGRQRDRDAPAGRRPRPGARTACGSPRRGVRALGARPGWPRSRSRGASTGPPSRAGGSTPRRSSSSGAHPTPCSASSLGGAMLAGAAFCVGRRAASASACRSRCRWPGHRLRSSASWSPRSCPASSLPVVAAACRSPARPSWSTSRSRPTCSTTPAPSSGRRRCRSPRAASRSRCCGSSRWSDTPSQHAGYGSGFALCAGLMATGAALFIVSQQLPGLEPARRH